MVLKSTQPQAQIQIAPLLKVTHLFYLNFNSPSGEWGKYLSKNKENNPWKVLATLLTLFA